MVANSCLLEVRETKHTGDLREQACWAKCQGHKMDGDAQLPLQKKTKQKVLILPGQVSRMTRTGGIV